MGNFPNNPVLLYGMERFLKCLVRISSVFINAKLRFSIVLPRHLLKRITIDVLFRKFYIAPAKNLNKIHEEVNHIGDGNFTDVRNSHSSGWQQNQDQAGERL